MRLHHRDDHIGALTDQIVCVGEHLICFTHARGASEEDLERAPGVGSRNHASESIGESASRPRAHGVSQGEIHLEHIDRGLAQETPLASRGVLVDDRLHLRLGAAAVTGDTRYL